MKKEGEIMSKKHLIKNQILYKMAFFVACAAVLLLAGLSVCATSQANAQAFSDQSINAAPLNWKVKGPVGKECEWIYHDEYYETHLGLWKDEVNPSEYFSDYLVNNLKNSKCKIWVRDWYLKFDFDIDNDGEFDEATLAIDPNDYNPSWSYRVNGGGYAPLSHEVFVSGAEFNDKYVFKLPGASADGVDISGVVSEADKPWKTIPGAFVQYYQRTLFGDIPIPEKCTFTDWLGNYTIEEIDTEELFPGVIKVYKDGYKVAESLPLYYAPEETYMLYRYIQMTPVSDVDLADVEINGGAHHANFVTSYELVKDGKVVESDGGTFNKIEYQVPVGSSYAVYDDGTLHCSYAFDENGNSSSVAYTVKAVPEEGYTLDKWNINGEDLVPGKDYILKANDVMGLASYKLAEQPVPPVPPTPVPTPVNPGGGTAQTGDVAGYAFAVFAVIALLSAGVLAGRKLYNK